MRRFIKTIIAIVFAALLLLAAVFSFNFFGNGIVIKNEIKTDLPIVSGDISVLNWNLGYAGLGKDSDFYMDGGVMFSPPSKEIVETNLAGIRNILSENKSDFHIFQEISEPDMLTLGVDVLKGVKDELSDYSMHYSSDFRTRFIPTKWALRHGLGAFTRIKTSPVDLIRLTNEPTKLGGVIQRQYHMVTTEFEHADGTQWILLNLHLSAFDEGGNVRLKQLNELIVIADTFYQSGKHVIVGGDWNIQLSDTEFPTTTKEEFLFWRTKLPREKILPGWEIVVDENTPTMRSNERPYTKGENFTSIIDGYMVSPNVDTISVETIDTNFEFTDHQPVKAVFRAKTK
jgi:exonuclease III